MSHEITTTDEMFSVRQQPWHGLGQVLSDYPTREAAQALVHPWEPVEEPLFRRIATINDEGELLEKYEEVASTRLNVRSDNGAELGAVSDTFQTVSNNEMWDIAEALQGSAADVMYETGGSFAGGRKVWILIRLVDPLTVKGDPHGAVVPYYSLQNSHDGSGSFRGQATMSRIVCRNTAHLADIDAESRGTEFTFRHTRNVGERVEEARAALAGWREGLTHWQELSAFLMEQTVDEAAAQLFLESFIPEPVGNVISDRVRGNIHHARTEWSAIYEDSVTTEGIRGTAYGLVQAASEWSEHYRRARTEESRFKRAFLDRNSIIADARTLALEVAR
jgi:phage/plasmid-like protein (TIGR03299 family)